jgi:DNA modification methylase
MVEPRSNNAIAAGLSSFQGITHHQGLDVARHPEKATATDRKLRPKDRPLQNDFVSTEQFRAMLHQWFGNIARVLLPGRAWYIWGGYSNCGNYPPALAEAGLYFSQAIIWVKEHPVLTRKDFMGNHEWCQPADTKISMPGTARSRPLYTAFGNVGTGDCVVSYSRNHDCMVGLRRGQKVTCTDRHYEGPLHEVRVGHLRTCCTPGHKWTVKLHPDADKMWCTYLMRRGNWWRAGKSRLLSSYGFALKQRLSMEDGDEAWILSLHRDNVAAMLQEQIVLAEYGIPTVVWRRNDLERSKRSLLDVDKLYAKLDLGRMHTNAIRAIVDHGRCVHIPFVRRDRLSMHPRYGRRDGFHVRAANLLPGAMMLPIPADGQKVHWEVIDAVRREHFTGIVRSMDVDRYGHYVADGIVTHNCFYGWREGAAHRWFGPNNATDVWSVKKINPQSMVHLTEKPVELAARAMQYSSQPGENVLDLFGGSGSTLIAAEQTGRRAFLMEIDPPYCDVIISRWEKFTGKKADLAVAGSPAC